MARFLELTKKVGSGKVYVSADRISGFFEQTVGTSAETVVNISGGLSYIVKETPKEIIQLLGCGIVRKMFKVETAEAIYTGGGIWLFTGRFESGEYFLCDDDGYVEILDADPSDDWDVSLDYLWQEKHMIGDLGARENLDLSIEILEAVRDRQEDFGITDEEIDNYIAWFKEC